MAAKAIREATDALFFVAWVLALLNGGWLKACCLELLNQLDQQRLLGPRKLGAPT